MRIYNHIFFDLDHTLWDFDRNSAETISELYVAYDFKKLNLFSSDDFITKFGEINNQLWAMYNVGKIDKKEIRENRFRKILVALGCNYAQIPTDIGEVYLHKCPQKPHVMPHTYEILDQLTSKYTLNIITNGFDDVQQTKLNCAQLSSYFTHVITSESTGSKKPDAGIFNYAFDKSNAMAKESLMIGDNLATDIAGARNVKMDQVFYNPNRLIHNQEVTFEISSLQQLNQLL